MSTSLTRLKDRIATASSAVKTALRTFAGEFTLVGTFFVLTVTVSNLAYQLFGFTLVPVVKTSFDAFHELCHWILDTLVFSWVTALLEWLWYGALWVASRFLPVIPWRIQVSMPDIVSDYALVSLALTRVFLSADVIVPRQRRAEAEGQMTPQLWADIERAEGILLGPIHRFIHRINAGIWQVIDTTQRLITKPFRRYGLIERMVRGGLIALAGTVLFWGYIRLAGYTINVLMARRLASPIMVVRKRLFAFFWLNLLGAALAAALFFVLNAWLAESLEPSIPTSP